MNNRIAEIRKDRGLSMEKLAELTDTSRQQIHRLESGDRRLTVEWMERLGRALNCEPAELLVGATDLPAKSEVDLASRRPLPAAATLARDLPVIGTAAGGDNGDFDMNGQIVDYVRRPPAMAGLKEAFAIYLVGDSMSPRYDNGGLLFVHPGRPAGPGNDVLIEMHGEHGGVGHCMVKTLLRKAGGNYILKQYNPPRDDIEVPAERVKHIYRVLRNEELLGV